MCWHILWAPARRFPVRSFLKTFYLNVFFEVRPRRVPPIYKGYMCWHILQAPARRFPVWDFPLDTGSLSRVHRSSKNLELLQLKVSFCSISRALSNGICTCKSSRMPVERGGRERGRVQIFREEVTFEGPPLEQEPRTFATKGVVLQHFESSIEWHMHLQKFEDIGLSAWAGTQTTPTFWTNF